MGKVRRNRKIRTCEYCYNHKLKCDRENPCSTCIRRKQDCIYHFKEKNDNSRSEQNDMKDSDSGINDDFMFSEKGSGTLKDGEEEDFKLRSNVQFTSTNDKSSLYYSRAFLPYLEPSLNRICLFKMSEMGESGYTKNDFSHVGTYDFQKFGLQLSFKTLAQQYPLKEEFDEIVDIYWRNIHPIIPVIDKETTMAKYHEFWNLFNDKEKQVFDIDSGVLFIAMMLAVLTSLEVVEKDAERLRNIKERKNRAFETFEKFRLIFGLSTNPNLVYIQSSIIILQSSCMYYLGIFTFTAVIARQAEYMGLHRDPILHDIIPNKKSVRQSQIRRTVWHYVRFLDTSSSVITGMSPHMIMVNGSTNFPSKRDYNPSTKRFDGDLNPFMIFTICRFKSSLVMETILHYLNSDFSSDQEKLLRWDSISKTVTALYQDVYTLVSEIFSCAKDNRYSKKLCRWLVAYSATAVHQVYLFHRACDRRPYSHHNRVIVKPRGPSSSNLSDFSHIKSLEEFYEQILTIRMPYYETTVEVSILFLYESRIRVDMSDELSKFKWFNKNANPLQYIYFVIRDLYHYPSKRYTFESLPQEIKLFIFEDELLKYDGDVRILALDYAMNALKDLKEFWTELLTDFMDCLIELKNFVYNHLKNSTSGAPGNEDNSSSKAQHYPNPYPPGLDPREPFDLQKYQNIMEIVGSLGGQESPIERNNPNNSNEFQQAINRNGSIGSNPRAMSTFVDQNTTSDANPYFPQTFGVPSQTQPSLFSQVNQQPYGAHVQHLHVLPILQPSPVHQRGPALGHFNAANGPISQMFPQPSPLNSYTADNASMPMMNHVYQTKNPNHSTMNHTMNHNMNYNMNQTMNHNINSDMSNAVSHTTSQATNNDLSHDMSTPMDLNSQSITDTYESVERKP
ncbi:unnamed protein product [Pichia kudriavzevii]